MRRLSRLATLPVLLLIAALAIGACGGDDDDEGGDSASSAKELTGQLAPASAVTVGTELKTEQEFEWTDPIDFAVEGTFLPQSVSGVPSRTVHGLEDAGFESGAGKVLVSDDGSIHAFVDVVRLDSEEGAAEARDLLNENNLQQPCPGPCSVSPTQAGTVGVPDAKAVHLVPLEGAELPPGAGPPFEARAFEFTIGPYLYLLNVDGPPGKVSASDWKQTVEAVYEQAKQKTPSS